MRLRQKKARSLSEEAYMMDFQNQHFQTVSRKTDPFKKVPKDKSLSSTLIDTNKTQYAQILAKFINRVNIAKHLPPNKSKITQPFKNIPNEAIIKSKRLRKTSENTSFDEEKKVEHLRYSRPQIETQTKKIKIEQKTQKTSNLFSINKPTSIVTESINSKNESTQQNIINNCLLANSFNLNNYARFVQSPYISFTPQLLNACLEMNWQNMPFLAEDMRSGLLRQFQIYQRFKPQPSPSQIEKKSLPLTVLIQNQDQNTLKKPTIQQPTKKFSPDKIFKRASYHVGIAYSIYMDNIQKEGKKIKNFSDIDPTRFAKKYKSSQQRL